MKEASTPEKPVEQHSLWTKAIRRWLLWLGGLFAVLLIYIVSYGPVHYVCNRWQLDPRLVYWIYKPVVPAVNLVPGSFRHDYLNYVNWWRSKGTWAARRAAGTEEIYKAFE